MATLSSFALASTSSVAFYNSHTTLLPGRANSTSPFLRTRASESKCRHQKRGFSCNSFFGLGVPEIAVIAGVAALVFGPKKLPEIGRSIGKTVKSFQQAAKEFETELKKEPDSEIDSSPEKSTLAEEKKQQV